jgi:hypothetical protein
VDLRNWSNAFGDHPWWWTFPVFDEQPNRQAAPQLKPFFEQRPGRVVEVAGSKWWLDGLVQLQGRILTNPTRVYDEPGMLAFVWQRTALPIGKSFKSASWLQASVWAAPAGDVAGWLVWHYSDASVERVPVIYGKTTGRFWGDSQQIKSETAFPEPVWSFHENAAAVGKERWLRIYRQTWDNPHPAVRVISLDFVSNRASPAAPFLIALNLSE